MRHPGPSPRARALPAAAPEPATFVAWSWSSSVAPNVACNLDHQAQLSLLHLRRDRIAGVDAGEAALRADPEAVEIKLPRRLLDALLQRILAFHLRRLCQYNADQYVLVGHHAPHPR